MSQRMKKKSKLIFWTIWLVFSHWITYTFCSHLCMADAEKFFVLRECITARTSHLPDTHLRGSSKFTSHVVLNRFLQNFTQIVV